MIWPILIWVAVTPVPVMLTEPPPDPLAVVLDDAVVLVEAAVVCEVAVVVAGDVDEVADFELLPQAATTSAPAASVAASPRTPCRLPQITFTMPP